MTEPRVVVLMGVSGSGKTTVGQLLAEQLEWAFFDGDDFHPPGNLAKMASGRPLDDADRYPWLSALAELIRSHLGGSGAVVGCSALKAEYRRLLGTDDPRVLLVHLHGSPELLAERLGGRKGHFMPADLLASQLETLEMPEEEALIVDIEASPEEICRQIASRIR